MTETERDVDAEIVAAWYHRKRGLSVREIATELGCSVGTAHARVRAARDVERDEHLGDRDGLRATEAARLDDWTWTLERRMGTEGVAPEVAVPVLLRISERRAKLLGLDQPSRVAVSDDRTGHAPDPELAAKVRDAARLVERERDAIAAERT